MVSFVVPEVSRLVSVAAGQSVEPAMLPVAMRRVIGTVLVSVALVVLWVFVGPVMLSIVEWHHSSRMTPAEYSAAEARYLHRQHSMRLGDDSLSD